VPLHQERYPGVIGLFIWARIADQRQRSFVMSYPGRPPGFQDREDIRGSMHAGRRQPVAGAGQTPASVLVKNQGVARMMAGFTDDAGLHREAGPGLHLAELGLAQLVGTHGPEDARQQKRLTIFNGEGC
jgi:hypothetical protein